MNPMEKMAWWRSLPLNPFRLFFPLGILFGVIGVGHWVLWSVGWKLPSIALVHASLQTQGFLPSFVIGFLMTAFPRFTGTWPANRFEIGIMTVLLVSFLFATLNHQWLNAQMCFLGMIVNLIVFAVRRVPHRKKELPPSFLLMGFGFLHALLGPILILVSRFGTSSYPLFLIGRQMVQVGFLLCMVLGVTGKLAPFLLGYVDDPEQSADSTSGLFRGKKVIVIHGLTGAAILVSFLIEAVSQKTAMGMRAVVVTAHLLSFARIARPLRKKTTLMVLFHISCWMIPLGLWVGFIWPNFRIAALHLLFIGGFSLMIFSFGTLIVLSHSLKAALINGRLVFLRVVGTFVLAAAIIRFLAETIPSRYAPFIHTSSGLWVLAALTWGVVLSPAMFRTINLNSERRPT
jgi:uncharacterized protein involved in response to NO